MSPVESVAGTSVGRRFLTRIPPLEPGHAPSRFSSFVLRAPSDSIWNFNCPGSRITSKKPRNDNPRFRTPWQEGRDQKDVPGRLRERLPARLPFWVSFKPLPGQNGEKRPTRAAEACVQPSAVTQASRASGGSPEPGGYCPNR